MERAATTREAVTRQALASQAALASTGPSVLTGISVSPDLNCSATHSGFAHADIFYQQTACGTFIVVDGAV